MQVVILKETSDETEESQAPAACAQYDYYKPYNYTCVDVMLVGTGQRTSISKVANMRSLVHMFQAYRCWS